MSYYEHHVLFCCNQRQGGDLCCANANAEDLRAYAKERIRALGLNGAGRVRINSAGCLDRCSDGPVVVVYPEGVWYTYLDKADIDEIIDAHLVKGQLVRRLCLDESEQKEVAA